MKKKPTKLTTVALFQGSRKCRAKIITDIINGQTSIVNVKGQHNHEINIKRNKPVTRFGRRRHPGVSSLNDLKVEVLDDDQYQDFIIEEDENLQL